MSQTDHFDVLHGMVNQQLKSNPPPPVWRTIFLTIPVYATVHTDHFEGLYDMVHQMCKQKKLQNCAELVFRTSLCKTAKNGQKGL